MRVIFYETATGRSPVREFFAQLSQQTREELIGVLALLENGRILQMPLSRNLSSIWPGLHEIRLRDRDGQIRVFYYVKKDDALYLVHAYRKKTREISNKEVAVILARIRSIGACPGKR